MSTKRLIWCNPFHHMRVAAFFWGFWGFGAPQTPSELLWPRMSVVHNQKPPSSYSIQMIAPLSSDRGNPSGADKQSHWLHFSKMHGACRWNMMQTAVSQLIGGYPGDSSLVLSDAIDNASVVSSKSFGGNQFHCKLKVADETACAARGKNPSWPRYQFLHAVTDQNVCLRNYWWYRSLW